MIADAYECVFEQYDLTMVEILGHLEVADIDGATYLASGAGSRVSGDRGSIPRWPSFDRSREQARPNHSVIG